MPINLAGKVIRTLRLPTTDYSGSPVPVVSAEQGDINTRYLKVVMYDDGGNVDMSKYDAVLLKVEPPDGENMASEGQIIDGAAYCVLLPEMLVDRGKLRCNVVLGNSQGNVLTSKVFYVYVSKTNLETGGENYNILITLVQRVNDIEKSITEAESGREDAETVRVNNEFGNAGLGIIGRVPAENARVLAEQGRNAAENQRSAAEQGRITAENARKTAETIRQANETVRQETYLQIAEDAEEAKIAAQSAEVSANQANESAGIAEDSAVASAQSATEAQSAATVAKQLSEETAQGLADEIQRATNAENKIASDLSAEIERSVLADQNNAQAIVAERNRAQASEQVNANSIAAEVVRAIEAEQNIVQDLANEVQRATQAEHHNANAITAESQRAQTIETNKVDKIHGKGLSTEDFTTAEKHKLAGLAIGVDGTPILMESIMKYRGIFDRDMSYFKNDIVTGDISTMGIDGYATYVSLTDGNKGNTPPLNTSNAFWQHIGSFGDSGYIGRCRYPEIYSVGTLSGEIDKKRGLILTDMDTYNRKGINGTLGVLRQGYGQILNEETNDYIVYTKGGKLYDRRGEVAAKTELPKSPSEIGAEPVFTKNTAFNKNYAIANPCANGEATPGSADNVSRGDHRHPTDNTRADTNLLNVNVIHDTDYPTAWQNLPGRTTISSGIIQHGRNISDNQLNGWRVAFRYTYASGSSAKGYDWSTSNADTVTITKAMLPFTYTFDRVTMGVSGIARITITNISDTSITYTNRIGSIDSSETPSPNSTPYISAISLDGATYTLPPYTQNVVNRINSATSPITARVTALEDLVTASSATSNAKSTTSSTVTLNTDTDHICELWFTTANQESLGTFRIESLDFMSDSSTVQFSISTDSSIMHLKGLMRHSLTEYAVFCVCENGSVIARTFKSEVVISRIRWNSDGSESGDSTVVKRRLALHIKY